MWYTARDERELTQTRGEHQLPLTSKSGLDLILSLALQDVRYAKGGQEEILRRTHWPRGTTDIYYMGGGELRGASNDQFAELSVFRAC